MKQLILFFVLFAPMFVMAQYDEGEFTHKGKTKEFSAQTFVRNGEFDAMSQTDVELEFMRYCNFKYHDMRQKALGLSVIGLAAGVGSVMMDNEDNATVLAGISGICAIGSAGIYIAAEKWLKYSSIKPARTGIGIAITF